MYAIPPVPNTCDRSYAFWDNGFKLEELKKIIELGNKAPKKRAVTAGAKEGDALKDVRDSKIGWLPANDATSWLYERLCAQAWALNNEHFQLDLLGLVDELQYTIYSGASGGHYDWHIDMGGRGSTPRKLSFSMLLNDPMDFEGGELWVWGYKREAVPKVRGRMYVFPSYTLHRVTPVTSGVRRSLVGWIAGPQIK